LDVAKEMMVNGDAGATSRSRRPDGQGRDLGPQKLHELGDMILERADAEQKIFRRLGRS